ncbi:MAG: lysophospholipid acyltransferase family protein [Pseudomonadota bacterium]
MLQRIVAFILYCLARLFNLTYRYYYRHFDGTVQRKLPIFSRNYVFALWHQNIISTLFSNTKESHALMVSSSKDGNLIAYALEKLGHKTARGSSTRGGSTALTGMVELVKQGHHAAITIDGPLGPPHVVKNGVLRIAQLADTPIIPISCVAQKKWVFHKSWDQFRLPRFFTKIFVYYGEPFSIPGDMPEEQFEQFKEVLKGKLEEGERLALEELCKI